jgi:DNA replicative helicase MCM subunit Mcm2 (Cdc46/Mcm family)
MLKKYITYAKLNVFPKIHDADLDKISHVYAELRRESSVSSFGVFYRASYMNFILYVILLKRTD